MTLNIGMDKDIDIQIKPVLIVHSSLLNTHFM